MVDFSKFETLYVQVERLRARLSFAQDSAAAFKASVKRAPIVLQLSQMVEKNNQPDENIVDLGQRETLPTRAVKALAGLTTLSLLAWATGFFLLFATNVVIAFVLATKVLGLRIDIPQTWSPS